MDLDLLGIRTNAADEKARACKILSVFVDDLHAALLPWLPQIMHTLIPLLNTAPFDDMKLAALATMPELLVALALYYHTSTDYILELTDQREPYPQKRR